jgi:succinate dehydrogenase/fumarate reductase flavoprotein subunit
MTTVIKPKRSETASAIPTAGALAVGELAMNVTDGKFYTKKSDNSVVEVGGAGAATLQDITSGSKNVTTNNIVLNGSQLVFEGNLENAYETFLNVTEPTADRTLTLPNQSGVLATEGDNLAFSIVFGG